MYIYIVNNYEKKHDEKMVDTMVNTNEESWLIGHQDDDKVIPGYTTRWRWPLVDNSEYFVDNKLLIIIIGH